jgi:hypothetical protein
LFSEYSCDEDHPYFYREIYPTKEASVVHEKLNLIVVKRSIKKILRNDPKATKDFYEYLDLINPYKDIDVISCSQVGCLIFPLLGFSQERSLFEFELRQRFGDGVFCIEELGQYAEENEMFAGIAAAACYIWGKYIKTNQECLLKSKVEAERNNDYFINEVYGSNYRDLIKKEGVDTIFSNDVSVKPKRLALQKGLVPNLVEILKESEEKTCKSSTQENIDRWCEKVEKYYSPTGKYKVHGEICLKIASEEGFKYSDKYIANKTRQVFQKLSGKKS